MRKVLLLLIFASSFTFLFAQMAGDVIVNEIMQNPSEVSDANGEWFEIYNTTNADIDIENWIFSDNGTNEFTISGSLIIPALGYLVIGINDNISTNGGAPVDYDWGNSGDFQLTNGDDEVIITAPGPIEIDRVEYDGGPDFPDPTGASMALDDPANDNNVGANWETSTSQWPGSDGDLGTPGESNSAPAPITLASFTAKPMNNTSVELDWITSSEENNDYFNIEHSTNGRDFITIDQVAGALNSTEVRYYSYMHEDAPTGMNYYRLRQVDTDGAFSFSDVEAVRIGQQHKIEVLPTLAESSIQVLVADGLDREANVEVYNVLGQMVAAELLERGATQLEINVNDLQAGHYFVRLNNGQSADITRFIKQ